MAADLRPQLEELRASFADADRLTQGLMNFMKLDDLKGDTVSALNSAFTIANRRRGILEVAVGALSRLIEDGHPSALHFDASEEVKADLNNALSETSTAFNSFEALMAESGTISGAVAPKVKSTR